MIPPRKRGPYLSAVLGTAAIGTTIGPIIGGALALSNWRWIFWLSLPVSGLGLAAILFFLSNFGSATAGRGLGLLETWGPACPGEGRFSGGMAGAFMSKTGLYRPLHWAGFAMSAVGMGLFSRLDQESSTAEWIGYQIIASGRTGIIFTATLPRTLAPLGEKDVGVATGTYSFVRSFALVRGVTPASIVFNGRFNSGLRNGDVSDLELRTLLADGVAYAYAASPAGDGGMDSLDDETKAEVVGIYVQSLQVVWLVVMGVACLGFLTTFVEKHVELRREHESEFGLKSAEQSESDRSGLREAEEGIGGTPANNDSKTLPN